MQDRQEPEGVAESHHGAARDGHEGQLQVDVEEGERGQGRDGHEESEAGGEEDGSSLEAFQDEDGGDGSHDADEGHDEGGEAGANQGAAVVQDANDVDGERAATHPMKTGVEDEANQERFQLHRLYTDTIITLLITAFLYYLTEFEGDVEPFPPIKLKGIPEKRKRNFLQYIFLHQENWFSIFFILCQFEFSLFRQPKWRLGQEYHDGPDRHRHGREEEGEVRIVDEVTEAVHAQDAEADAQRLKGHQTLAIFWMRYFGNEHCKKENVMWINTRYIFVLPTAEYMTEAETEKPHQKIMRTVKLGEKLRPTKEMKAGRKDMRKTWRRPNFVVRVPPTKTNVVLIKR